MTGSIELKNPIKINGKEVSTLTYDTDAITAGMFAEADASRQKIMGPKGAVGSAFEVDYTLQLYLGLQAVIAVNPSYDLADLVRVQGYDIVMLTRLGRNFISGRSVELSPQSESESSSESTPEDSTPPSKSSKSKAS